MSCWASVRLAAFLLVGRGVRLPLAPPPPPPRGLALACPRAGLEPLDLHDVMVLAGRVELAAGVRRGEVCGQVTREEEEEEAGCCCESSGGPSNCSVSGSVEDEEARAGASFFFRMDFLAVAGGGAAAAAAAEGFDGGITDWIGGGGLLLPAP